MEPLAERMRPKKLEDYWGQEKLVGKNGMISQALKENYLPSMILWGPPGVGKTTLAELVAQASQRMFFALSAINAGVKEIREVIQKAAKQRGGLFQSPILFIDEIHRFSKSQQDALLQAVEQGLITLIGATTENPSFEIINALLSRCQIYVLQALSPETLQKIVENALSHDILLKKRNIELSSFMVLLRYAQGDARKALNIVELAINTHPEDPLVLTDEIFSKVLDNNPNYYSKKGEEHYDVISAFIKSIRGSDPNAAVYWLARMIDGGEDVKFIARRLIILAAEDIGLANPNALLLANNCMEAVHKIGLPEGRIVLSQTALYLALSPKSNSAYLAIDNALDTVRTKGHLPVPLSLRNAPTSMMKNMGFGKDYGYSHLYPENFKAQNFLPNEVQGSVFYTPGNNSIENKYLLWLKEKWKKFYPY
jgi:putative ATPase